MKRCVLPELLKIVEPIGPDQQEIERSSRHCNQVRPFVRYKIPT